MLLFLSMKQPLSPFSFLFSPFLLLKRDRSVTVNGVDK